ncbi:MAG: MerR family transcriptional regulator [Candidatus Delongbacteria bacterium]|nr:MerR family transcriptional regulator [Candidatus Delongbacteria bacterium]
MNPTMMIGELAEQALVSRRTIRYYVQMGLLPAPEQRGAYSEYRSEHLVRLLLIRRLQGLFWPLDRIRRKLDGMTAEELESSLNNQNWPGDETFRAAIIDQRNEETRMDLSPNSNAAAEFSRSIYYRWFLAEGLELHATAEWKERFERDSKQFHDIVITLIRLG